MLKLSDQIFKKIEKTLADKEAITNDLYQSDNNKVQYDVLVKKLAYISKVEQLFEEYRLLQENLSFIEEVISAGVDISSMQEEIKKNNDLLAANIEKIESLFSQDSDKDDIREILLEIRAGSGGDEAGLFANELMQMYLKYGQLKGWKVEVLSCQYNAYGGLRESICKISGDQVYRKLQFESGVHRVQRVPATEAQGRIHTSTCTVAILQAIDKLNDIQINPSDIRIDTFRSSGAGGQHVNKTDSAVRIIHLPTKIKVECQNDRSQHRNKEEALGILKARLLAMQKSQHEQELSKQRKSLMGTGDRSERIRTYNYPQKRVTDHRIGLTNHKLEDLLAGHLDWLVEALMTAKIKQIDNAA